MQEAKDKSGPAAECALGSSQSHPSFGQLGTKLGLEGPCGVPKASILPTRRSGPHLLPHRSHILTFWGSVDS